MMRNLTILSCTALLAFGLSFSAFAGSITDNDGDGVPDAFDNCVTTANGPLAGSCSAQQDAGVKDGYGTACDADINDDGVVALGDVGAAVAALGSTVNPEADFNCDGVVGLGDVGYAVAELGNFPGPSGLACAGVGPYPCVAS
jgi:hypothetical protein